MAVRRPALRSSRVMHRVAADVGHRDQLPGVLACRRWSVSSSDIETLEAWIDNGADLVACGAQHGRRRGGHDGRRIIVR